MRPASVVLALDTALDVDGARRLHDFADLDDAGVARGLEQVWTQRFGYGRAPAYLRRIERLAAVVEQGEDVRILAFDAEPGAQGERALLTSLCAAWPQRAGETVDWAGDSMALLLARAFVHDMTVPEQLPGWPRIALAERFDPDALGADAEADVARLIAADRPDGSASDATTTLRSVAIDRYRWWLRWQYVCGRLSASGRERREAALAAGGGKGTS